MANNQNKKDLNKNYQQKNNNNQNNNQFSKNNSQYQQEAGNEFLNDNQANGDRSGFIMPDINEESGIGMNADYVKKANKNNLKKK